MADEVKKPEENNEIEKNYIEQIQKLKDTTVSKETYERVVEDNKKLTEILTNGGQLEGAEKEEPHRSKEELRKILFNDDCSCNNLKYVEAAVELRDIILEEDKIDIFLPHGENIAPTAEDQECAERVAKAFKDCIEYAEGDSELFTNELMRITKDANPIASRAAANKK